MELSFETGIRGHAAIGFAGDTLNTAVYLKRYLGPRGDVAFVSAAGHDPYSDAMLDLISSESVITDHVSRMEGKLPGIYGISIDAMGERSFHYWRENSAARALFEDADLLPWKAIRSADLLYYSGITLALLSERARRIFFERLENARREDDLQVAFDSNFRPALWPCAKEASEAIATAWQTSDIALPSLDDELMVFGESGSQEVLSRLRGYGLCRGALKCGLEGAFPINPEITSPPLTPVEDVVDTTAAGDSFNGAYLASVLTGAPEVEAIAAGHACASQVIQKRGAIVAFENDGSSD